MSALDIVFDGEVRCLGSADGKRMKLQGRSNDGGGLEFICRHEHLPPLPPRLDEVQLTELGSPAQSPRRFELRSRQVRLELRLALQLHHSVGSTMFAVIPPQPAPRWFRGAWWLLLSLLRIPGLGRMLLSSRGAA